MCQQKKENVSTERGESVNYIWVYDERHKQLWRAPQIRVTPAIKSCGDRRNPRYLTRHIHSFAFVTNSDGVMTKMSKSLNPFLSRVMITSG